VWALYVLDRAGALPPSDFTEESAHWLFFLGLVGIIFCVTLLSLLFETIAAALRRRLVAARESAVEANRAKSAFLARMSHEIRTPMHGVFGMLELLDDTEATDRQREYTRLARQSAESLLRILNDILDFSKIEAGRLELESIPFDLREGVGDTLQALAVDAEAKGLELVCHIPPEVPNDLLGDPGRLRQILVNLVGNAVKFTAEGEIVVSISRMDAPHDRSRLAFRVQDSGLGIPLDKQAQIWDVFGQADVSTTRRFGGTGLGLNISRQLVRMMGGELTFESEEGEGTTFSFTLDFGMPDLAGRRRDLPDAALEGVHVLVVDDNATNRFLLEEILENWGMVVTSVEGARPALEALRRACSPTAGSPTAGTPGSGSPGSGSTTSGSTTPGFGVVLLDVMMPDVDGLALAEQIRRDPTFDGIPLILLSSSHATQGAARCEALGIVGQLKKPVKQSELLQALHLALSSDEGLRERPPPPPAPSAPPSRPLRILLADDGALNRMVATGLLEARGHEVTVAEDGREAVAAWQEGVFDLILMDLEMPEMDGLEATRWIRERERGGKTRVPIVALTAHAILEYEERCLAAGMDAHLAKPLEPERLDAILRELT